MGASAGQGKSDGMVFGVRLFQSARKCALLVHAACIRPDKENASTSGPVVTDVSIKLSTRSTVVVCGLFHPCGLDNY